MANSSPEVQFSSSLPRDDGRASPSPGLRESHSEPNVTRHFATAPLPATSNEFRAKRAKQFIRPLVPAQSWSGSEGGGVSFTAGKTRCLFAFTTPDPGFERPADTIFNHTCPDSTCNCFDRRFRASPGYMKDPLGRLIPTGSGPLIKDLSVKLQQLRVDPVAQASLQQRVRTYVKEKQKSKEATQVWEANKTTLLHMSAARRTEAHAEYFERRAARENRVLLAKQQLERDNQLRRKSQWQASQMRAKATAERDTISHSTQRRALRAISLMARVTLVRGDLEEERAKRKEKRENRKRLQTLQQIARAGGFAMDPVTTAVIVLQTWMRSTVLAPHNLHARRKQAALAIHSNLVRLTQQKRMCFMVGKLCAAVKTIQRAFRNARALLYARRALLLLQWEKFERAMAQHKPTVQGPFTQIMSFIQQEGSLTAAFESMAGGQRGHRSMRSHKPSGAHSRPPGAPYDLAEMQRYSLEALIESSRPGDGAGEGGRGGKQKGTSIVVRGRSPEASRASRGWSNKGGTLNPAEPPKFWAVRRAIKLLVVEAAVRSRTRQVLAEMADYQQEISNLAPGWVGNEKELESMLRDVMPELANLMRQKTNQRPYWKVIFTPVELALLHQEGLRHQEAYYTATHQSAFFQGDPRLNWFGLHESIREEAFNRLMGMAMEKVRSLKTGVNTTARFTRRSPTERFAGLAAPEKAPSPEAKESSKRTVHFGPETEKRGKGEKKADPDKKKSAYRLTVDRTPTQQELLLQGSRTYSPAWCREFYVTVDGKRGGRGDDDDDYLPQVGMYRAPAATGNAYLSALPAAAGRKEASEGGSGGANRRASRGPKVLQDVSDSGGKDVKPRHLNYNGEDSQSKALTPSSSFNQDA